MGKGSGVKSSLGLNGGEVLLLDALRRAGPPYESSPSR